INTTMFREVSEYVSRASGRILPSWKAIVGDNMFRHESGIHADGAIKNPRNYEAFDPKIVGLERQIIIGKHSGKAGVVNKFKEYGVNLDEKSSQVILEMVRATSVRLKRSLFDKELVQIYKEYLRLSEEQSN
ncbi:homoaconitate hydratase, partial [Clostridium perfringens]|nr:homoaconitate hydratase [Clostridium perfringens]